MTDTAKTKFSNNLIALAGLLTAVGGLLTVLHQTGVLSFTSKEKPVLQEVLNKPEKNSEGQKIMENQNDIVVEKEMPVQQLTEEKSIPVSYKEPDASVFNLSGYWYDIINAGRYYFTHDASGKISFQEYSFLEGTWIVTAEGVGTVNGNSVKIPYTTLYGLSGIFDGMISEQGQTVSGTARDLSSGVRTQLHLNKE